MTDESTNRPAPLTDNLWDRELDRLMATRKSALLRDTLNIAEARAYLGVGERTMYGLAESGEVGGIKMFRRWHFTHTKLDLFLARRLRAKSTKKTKRRAKATTRRRAG